MAYIRDPALEINFHAQQCHTLFQAASMQVYTRCTVYGVITAILKVNMEKFNNIYKYSVFTPA